MLRPVLASVGRVLRAVWIAIGVVLATLLLIEIAYRTQGVARAAVRDWRAPKQLPNPAAPILAETYSTAEHTDWYPYIYFRRKPYTGRYTTIDSLGRRATVLAIPASAVKRDLFMFGASPLWGTGLRDSMTIPSRLSSVLAARGVRDVGITNFGEGGEVITQEVIDLILQLRAGKRPAVVVFYDGYNDIAAAMANGRAGATKSEADRAQAYHVGNTLFAWQHDAGTEVRAAALLARIAASRLLIVQKLSGTSPTHEAKSRITDDSLVNDVVHTYAGAVEVIQALEKQFGFTAFYAWMPMLDPTQKHMSPFERQLNATMVADLWTVHFLKLHRMTVQRVQPDMQRLAPGRFVELSGLFANDSSTVYVEQGHTTEAASTVIAERLANYLVPLLAAHPPALAGARSSD
jgi:hypothetical protein